MIESDRNLLVHHWAAHKMRISSSTTLGGWLYAKKRLTRWKHPSSETEFDEVLSSNRISLPVAGILKIKQWKLVCKWNIAYFNQWFQPKDLKISKQRTHGIHDVLRGHLCANFGSRFRKTSKRGNDMQQPSLLSNYNPNYNQPTITNQQKNPTV